MVRYYGTQDERRAHRHKWRELLRNGLENAETTSSKHEELQILLTTYEVLFAFFKLFIVSPEGIIYFCSMLRSTLAFFDALAAIQLFSTRVIVLRT